mgnify:CR=1 FL=1
MFKKVVEFIENYYLGFVHRLLPLLRAAIREALEGGQHTPESHYDEEGKRKP